jgi:hypothetical protein
MNDFVKELKQTGYSNPVRENFEMDIRQEGVGNADLAGQFFGGVAEASKDLYGYAQKAEKAEAKAAEDRDKARVQATYNDFYRKKQKINEAVEQNRMSWTSADTATRKLMDDFSRIKGIEYSKLLQGVEASDFTGSYDREKETRKFWNTKKNEQQNKVWETMTAANPYLMDIFSPEEGMAWVNTVNDTWDSVERYAAELNTIDQYKDPAKYDRVSGEMMRAAGNNIQAALISEIFDEKGKINSSSKLQETKVRLRDKYLKLGMPAWKVDTSIDIGFRRSGIETKVDAVNKQHTLNDEDVKRWVKAGQNQFLVDIGATENPYIAMWTNTDDFKSGRIYTETTRKANIEMGKRLSNIINGYVNGYTPIPNDVKGEVYGKYSNVVNGNVGTPTLKGYALGDVLADAVHTYGDKDAETRKQAYAEIIKTFDNVYSDTTIKALKADADPVKRQLGETIERQMQQIRNLKKFADFEVTPTNAANSWNLLKEGPGMDLLRVNDEGHIVMVDGSKGLLQSTAITLSDATGRYFGAAEDLNEYFSEIYKDPQKRIEMFKDAGIPELDPMTETVIGRKEWYLGTGDSHIKARQQLEQNTQAGEWDFNAVEGLGGKIWEGVKGKIENIKEFLTVDGVADNSPFTKVLGLTPKETSTEIEKLEKTLENENLKPHIRRAVEGTIEILKSRAESFEKGLDVDKVEQMRTGAKNLIENMKNIDIPTAPELIDKGKNMFTDIVKRVSEDRQKTLATEQAVDILNTPKGSPKNKEEDLLNKIKTWVEKRKATKQAAEILQDPQVSKRFEAIEAGVKYALKEKNLTAKEQAIEEVAKEADEWSKQIDDEISALGIPQTFGEMEQMKKIMKEKEEILKLYDTFIGTYGKSSAEDKIETETPQVFGEARLSRSEPLTFAHMETPEVYKLTEEGTKAENKLLQSMGEYDTFLGVAAEGLYQERKKSLPKALQSEKDYDLRGAYKAGLLDNVEEGMHLPDTFKKPNHITFSKESKYYEEGMWAGEWVDDYTFKIPLNTPKAKLAKLKEYFAKYEPGARIMIDNPKALEELSKIEGEEENLSSALSSDPYMHEGYGNMYEADKEKLMHKRHRVLKDIYIYPGE